MPTFLESRVRRDYRGREVTKLGGGKSLDLFLESVAAQPLLFKEKNLTQPTCMQSSLRVE